MRHRSHNPTSALAGPIATVLVLSSLWTLNGCSAFRYAASLAGKTAEPAAYVPAKKPMIVVVRDQPDPSGFRVESDEIAGKVEQQIQAYQIAPIIPQTRLGDVRGSGPTEFQAMSPAQIGCAVGAEQVLFIQVVNSDFDSEATQDMLKGKISAMVSVVEVSSGKVLWPTDGSPGVLVAHQTPLLRLGDRNSRQSIEVSLHSGLAEKIGELFHEHVAEE